MGAFHSSKKKSKSESMKGGAITPIDRATLDLKVSRDRISKYRAKLELDTEKLTARAKALHADGKTKNALQLLRLRKCKLQEADRVNEQLLTVHRMIDKISEKQNEAEVVLAMKRGKDALQIMHGQMGIDDVLDLMDEIRDQDEVETRINEVLGREGLAVMDDLREADLAAELEQLENEARAEEGNEKENFALPEPVSSPLPKVAKDQSKPELADQADQRVAVASIAL